MSKASPDILKDFTLRNTLARENILNAFLSRPTALSHGDLESKLIGELDRVTIYRTLKTFLEKGLIHKILDDQGGVKYALCSQSCQGSEHHHHDHVHFKCQQCGDTTCLETVNIPTISLPVGYSRSEINMLVQGVCPQCK